MNLVPGSSAARIRRLSPELGRWVDDVVRQVDPGWLREQVERLPAPRNRLHAPEAMAHADELILRGFRDAGWQAERHPFTFTQVEGLRDHGAPEDFPKPIVYDRLEGANIVAVKEGAGSRDALVVLAHHDTIRDSPGADDNTASVAALLELARVLAPHRFYETVVLAAVDMEELGFFGVQALLGEVQPERTIIGAVNYETMAYTTSEPGSQALPAGFGRIYHDEVQRIHARGDRGDFTALIYNGRAIALAAALAAAMIYLRGRSSVLMVREPHDVPLVGRLLARLAPGVRDLRRSDHRRFWEAGLGAMMVSDTANYRYPHYHQPTDTPEKLDYDRLAAIVAATAGAVARVAGLLEPPAEDADGPAH